MTLTREQEDALRDLDAASKALKTAGKNAGAEKKYGLAYKKCVALGVKPKLKARYTI